MLYEAGHGAGKETGEGRGVKAERGATGLQLGAAHRKHVDHVCDTGRVENQRLVERRRSLRCRGRDYGSDNIAARRAQGARGAIRVDGGLGHARSAHQTFGTWL